MGTHSPDITVDRLESHLSERLDAAIVETDILQNGINLTIAISTARQQNAYVFRRPNPVRQTDYFSDLRREYEVLQRLTETAVSAPAPVLFSDDETVAGGPFFVMSHLDGTATPWGSTLPERCQNAVAREAVADQLIDTLAQIHTVDVEPFKRVCEEVTPTERVNTAVGRLERATSVTGRTLPMLRDVADWLQANVPADTTTTLVHGDYKPDNVLIAGTDRPRLAGVIDWEAARLGDPLTDLGFLLLFWRHSGDPTPSVEELETAYPNNDAVTQLRQTNERGFWPFTGESGCPTRREMIERYERQTGVSFENERFYRVLAAFTVATVWETFHRYRMEDGSDSHWEPLVDYMASVADDIVNGRCEL